jgi:hypothetical protein
MQVYQISGHSDKIYFLPYRPNIGFDEVPMTCKFFCPILPIFELSLCFGLKKMCRKFQIDMLSLKRVIVLPYGRTWRVHKPWIGLKRKVKVGWGWVVVWMHISKYLYIYTLSFKSCKFYCFSSCTELTCKCCRVWFCNLYILVTKNYYNE